MLIRLVDWLFCTLDDNRFRARKVLAKARKLLTAECET